MFLVDSFTWVIEIQYNFGTKNYTEGEHPSHANYVMGLPDNSVSIQTQSINWQHRNAGTLITPTATFQVVMGTRDDPVIREHIATEPPEGKRVIIRTIDVNQIDELPEGSGTIRFDGIILDRILDYVDGVQVVRFTAHDIEYQTLQKDFPPDIITASLLPYAPPAHRGLALPLVIGKVTHWPCRAVKVNVYSALVLDITATSDTIKITSTADFPGPTNSITHGMAQALYSEYEHRFLVEILDRPSWPTVGYVKNSAEIIQYFDIKDFDVPNNLYYLLYCQRGKFGTAPEPIQLNQFLFLIMHIRIGSEEILYTHKSTVQSSLHIDPIAGARGVDMAPWEGRSHLASEMVIGYLYETQKWLVAAHEVRSIQNVLIWDGSRFQHKSAVQGGFEEDFVIDTSDTDLIPGRTVATIGDQYTTMAEVHFQVTGANEFWVYVGNNHGSRPEKWMNDSSDNTVFVYGQFKNIIPDTYDYYNRVIYPPFSPTRDTAQMIDANIDSYGYLLTQIGGSFPTEIRGALFTRSGLAGISSDVRDAMNASPRRGMRCIAWQWDYEVPTSGDVLAYIGYRDPNYQTEFPNQWPNGAASTGLDNYMLLDIDNAPFGGGYSPPPDDDTWITGESLYVLGWIPQPSGAGSSKSDVYEIRLRAYWGMNQWPSDLGALTDGSYDTFVLFEGETSGGIALVSLLRLLTNVPEIPGNFVALGMKMTVRFTANRPSAIILGRVSTVFWESTWYSFKTEVNVTTNFVDSTTKQTDVVVDLTDSIIGEALRIVPDLLVDDDRNFWYLKIQSPSGDDMELYNIVVKAEYTPEDQPIDPDGSTILACSVEGAVDDAAGTYTGSPNALIEHPVSVYHWFLSEIMGVSSDRIDIGNFQLMRQNTNMVSEIRGGWYETERFLDVIMQLFIQVGAFPIYNGSQYQVKMWPPENSPTVAIHGDWNIVDGSFSGEWTKVWDIINYLRIFYNTNYLNNFSQTFIPFRIKNQSGERVRRFGVGVSDWRRLQEVLLNYIELKDTSSISAFQNSRTKYGQTFPYDLYATLVPDLVQVYKIINIIGWKDTEVKYTVSYTIPNEGPISFGVLDPIIVCNKLLPDIPGKIEMHGIPWEYFREGVNYATDEYPGAVFVITDIEWDKIFYYFKAVDLCAILDGPGGQ